MNKLPFRTGFEMTGIPAEHRERGNGCWWNTVMEGLSSRISLDIARKFPNFAPEDGYTDGHALEFQSPVFRSWGTLRRFYKTTFNSMKRMDVHPQHPDTICGGNHLHFDMDTQTGLAVMRLSIQHPEIVWVFTQPDDTDSCNNFTRNSYRKHAFAQIQSGLDYSNVSQNHLMFRQDAWNFVAGVCCNMDIERGYLETKSEAMGFNDNAFEFRCVEAPNNWEEFKDQLDFFIALTQYAGRNVSAIPRPSINNFPTHASLQKITRASAIKNFNKLVCEIGLSPKRYRKYVKRNLLPRWGIWTQAHLNESQPNPLAFNYLRRAQWDICKSLNINKINILDINNPSDTITT